MRWTDADAGPGFGRGWLGRNSRSSGTPSGGLSVAPPDKRPGESVLSPREWAVTVLASQSLRSKWAVARHHERSIPRSGAVTDEQRRHSPFSAQPSGRPFFSSETSLLAPYRSLKDMLVACAARLSS